MGMKMRMRSMELGVVDVVVSLLVLVRMYVYVYVCIWVCMCYFGWLASSRLSVCLSVYFPLSPRFFLLSVMHYTVFHVPGYLFTRVG